MDVLSYAVVRYDSVFTAMSQTDYGLVLILGSAFISVTAKPTVFSLLSYSKIV